MKRILLSLILLLLLASGTQAWYNDIGNDSCLTLYSDKENYQFVLGEPQTIELQVINQCGASFNANLGINFQNKDITQITFHTAQQATETETIQYERKYDCKGRIETTPIITENPNNLTAKCIEDANQQIGIISLQIPASRVDTKTGEIFVTIEEEQNNFQPLALLSTPNTLKYTEKTGFAEKQTIQNINIPEGTSYLTTTFTVPKGKIHERGEFVFTLINNLNPAQFSILDPWWNEGQYAVDGSTVALYHFNDNAGTTATDETGTYDITVSNANIWDAAVKKWGASSISPQELYTSNQPTLLDNWPATWTIDFWTSPTAGYATGYGSDESGLCKWNDITGGTRDGLDCYWRTANGEFRCRMLQNETEWAVFTSTNNWVQDTWYHIAVVFDNGKLGLSVNGVEEMNLGSATKPDTGTDTDFFVGYPGQANCSGTTTIFRIDELGISDVNRWTTPWTLGSTPDGNVTTIDGYPISGALPTFAYIYDGNLTIDFNVFDSDNERIYVDINYSTSNTQGTGTPLIQDLNLTSAVCTDQDWNDFPSACTWDWDIINVPDGNYYILMDLNNVINTNFKTTAKTLRIGNDVNLTIQVPIDEETLLPIDTNKYSFNLRVTRGDDVNSYTGFQYLTHLVIPLGTTTTIDIDLNSTDYFGRSYSVKYTIPKGDDVLQPYLVKTSAAGGTGFQSVLFTRTKTNEAIPLITIEAKKIIPITGLSVIERIITDEAGSATFSFVSGDTYFLDLYQDGNLVWQDIELRPVYTEYQLYIDTGTTGIPDLNAVNLDVTYSPNTSYIDSNTTVDINVLINVTGEIKDLNVLIFFDNNTLFNQAYATDGLKIISGISIVDAPPRPLTVQVILTTTNGIKIQKSKAYTVNLGSYQRQMIQALSESAVILNFERNSHHKEVTTLIAVILTILITGSIAKATKIDFGGQGILAMLILGIFLFIPGNPAIANSGAWIMFETYIVAVIITAGLIIFSKVI